MNSTRMNFRFGSKKPELGVGKLPSIIEFGRCKSRSVADSNSHRLLLERHHTGCHHRRTASWRLLLSHRRLSRMRLQVLLQHLYVGSALQVGQFHRFVGTTVIHLKMLQLMPVLPSHLKMTQLIQSLTTRCVQRMRITLGKSLIFGGTSSRADLPFHWNANVARIASGYASS